MFIPSLTGMIGFWSTLSLNIPDFTRYGKSQREQVLGQVLGLPTTMIAFSAMGVIITSASQVILPQAKIEDLWDPVKLLAYITSPVAPPGLERPLIENSFVRFLVALLSLFGISIATISVTIAADVVGPANDFANLAPKYISFKTGGLITGLIGIVIMPWKLMSSADLYIYAWLVGYSALLGPIAGIMIVDYWIIRNRELHVKELYIFDGRYPRLQTGAFVALTLSVLPSLPGFIRSA